MRNRFFDIFEILGVPVVISQMALISFEVLELLFIFFVGIEVVLLILRTHFFADLPIDGIFIYDILIEHLLNHLLNFSIRASKRVRKE